MSAPDYGPSPFPELTTVAQRVRMAVVQSLLASGWEFDAVDELLTEASTIATWVEDGGTLQVPSGLSDEIEAYERTVRWFGQVWSALGAWEGKFSDDDAHGRSARDAVLRGTIERVRDEMRETGEGK